jgi:hypothetical protein
MRRTPKLLLLTLCLGAAALPGAYANGAQSSGESERVASPAELVQQLADPRFAVRKRAMEQLVAQGVAAAAALEAGVESTDREVSFRSRHALTIIREHDFQRRLRAFAAGQDAQETYELPGWTLFRKEVGDGLEARRLFVEMQQAEPQLLQALERSPDKAVELLVQRLDQLQGEARTGQKQQSASLGTLAALLFVSNHDRGESVGMAVQNLAACYRYDVFVTAMEAGAEREILRKMLGTWIENARSWDRFQAMLLAIQFDLPQGLAPAKHMLADESRDPNQAVYRGFALQTIARFGDESHIPLVEPLLDDASPYGANSAAAAKASFQTQIRDIALATVVHLARQDPKTFGLTRLKPNSTQVFNTSSLAFENDAKRDEAIKKWRAFRAEQH